MNATTNGNQKSEIVWIPVGISLGAALGHYFNDMSVGMSVGLMAGATVSLAIDYRQRRRSLVWPLVGGFAVVWTMGLYLVERM